MKKIILVLLCALFSLSILTSCTKNKVKRNGLAPFTATNIMGGDVTEAIFQDYPLTLVFVWDSSNKANVEQLKHLGKLKEEFHDNDLNVVGIISDISFKTSVGKDEKIKKALGVISDSGTNFVEILESKDIYNLKLKNSATVPQIFFVDCNGCYVGDDVINTMTSEEWIVVIQERLQMIESSAY